MYYSKHLWYLSVVPSAWQGSYRYQFWFTCIWDRDRNHQLSQFAIETNMKYKLGKKCSSYIYCIAVNRIHFLICVKTCEDLNRRLFVGE